MSLYVHAGELPVIVDFTRFDRDSGYHNITIVANSTYGELTEWTYKFEVSGNTSDLNHSLLKDVCGGFYFQ